MLAHGTEKSYTRNVKSNPKTEVLVFTKDKLSCKPKTCENLRKPSVGTAAKRRESRKMSEMEGTEGRGTTLKVFLDDL